MASSMTSTSLVNQEALRMIWALALDDDELSDVMQAAAALALLYRMSSVVDEQYPFQLRARIASIEGNLRAQIIRSDTLLKERLETVLARDKMVEDDPPF